MAKSKPGSPTTIPGVKVVVETHMASVEDRKGVTVSCFASDRSRIGSDSAGAAYTIERRDLRRQYRVFAQQSRYQAIPIFSLISEEEKERFMRSGRHWRKSITLPQPPVAREFHIRHTYEHTAQEKTLFGCTARRWLITRLEERDASHGENWTETVSEEWYLDSTELKARFPGYSDQLIHRSMVTACRSDERLVHDRTGEPPRGLCACSETRYHSYMKFLTGEVREQDTAHISRITSITAELFDSSLFEPPAGFRKMPVYPGRLALVRRDLARSLARLRWPFLGRAQRSRTV